MNVRAIITGFNLTVNSIYEVLYEYDTAYEVRCDNGHVYCRNKDFFIPTEALTFEQMSEEAHDTGLCKYCPIPAELQRGVHTLNGYVTCEGSRCSEAYDKYLDKQLEEEDAEAKEKRADE